MHWDFERSKLTCNLGYKALKEKKVRCPNLLCISQSSPSFCVPFYFISLNLSFILSNQVIETLSLSSTVNHLPVVKEENVTIFRRYITEISCVEGYWHDISWRNIGPAIFIDLSREIVDFSRYIGDLAINRLFLATYRAVNAGQTRYSAPFFFFCCWEDLNPKPKGLGFTRLPPRLSCPLIHNMQQLYIYLNKNILNSKLIIIIL